LQRSPDPLAGLKGRVRKGERKRRGGDEGTRGGKARERRV